MLLLGGREGAGRGAQVAEAYGGAWQISSPEDHGDEFGFSPDGDEKALEVLNRGISRRLMFEKATLAAVKGTTGSMRGSRQASWEVTIHGNQVRDASVLWEEMGRRSKMIRSSPGRFKAMVESFAEGLKVINGRTRPRITPRSWPEFLATRGWAVEGRTCWSGR